jgi:cold shock CspA family protein
MQALTSSAMNTDDELDFGTVVFWDGRYGWARVDRGGPDVYLGAAELVRAGIERLKIGNRIRFEVRKATDGRRPWAAKIRLETRA